MDCSGRRDGKIKRPKIVVTANALFFFASFSFKIIFFIWGVPSERKFRMA